jgi:hypothetical protein
VTVTPCQSLTLASWWRAEGDDRPDLNMTFSLVGMDGQPIAADTHTLGDYSYVRANQWRTGEVYYDEHDLTVPCEQPDGDYVLGANLFSYDAATATADALNATVDGNPTGGFVYLTTLFIRSE